MDVVSSRDHLGDYLSIKVFDNDDDLIELVLIDRRSIGNFLTNKVRDLQLFLFHLFDLEPTLLPA